VAYRADSDYWRDLGTPESVALAAEDLKENLGIERQETLGAISHPHIQSKSL
jgi:hypothetical protein